jgi:hypothetical protein
MNFASVSLLAVVKRRLVRTFSYKVNKIERYSLEAWIE